MRKIINSYIIELLLFIRHWESWVFLILTFLSVSYHFISSFRLFDPGGALISTAFIVQGGIFASMILGLSLVQNEVFCWSDEMFYVLPNGYSSKIISKFLVLLSVIIMFNGISVIILYLIFGYYDVSSAFYWKSILYLFLYWGIPLVISGIIGMFMGLHIKSRLVYPLLIIIWLFIGPLNITVFKPLMAILKIDLNSIANFLNLGQMDPNVVYDPVYGFPLEIHRWLQKGLWILNISILFMISVLKKSNCKPTMQMISVLIILLSFNIPLITLYTDEEQVITTRYEENAVRNYDRNYYATNKYPVFKNPVSFAIESYEINMEVFRNFKAKVIMKIRPHKETEKIVFTLYHNLRVKKVFDGSNLELSYNQVGDQVLLLFPETLDVGVQHKITMIYEGTSSPYFYANEQAVMLPSYFPWLPVAGSYQSMKVDESKLIRNPLNLRIPTKFTLRYLGPQPLFTNLPKKGENLWSGEAPCGISLVAGMLTETKVDAKAVIYPVSLNKMIEGVPTFLESIEQTAEYIKDDFALSKGFNYSKVLFLSIPRESSLTSTSIWNLEDHLIVGIEQVLNDRDLINNKATFVPIVLSSLTRSYNMAKQDEKIRNMFIVSYDYWYSMNHTLADGDKYKPILLSRLDRYNYLKNNLENYEELGLKEEEMFTKQIKNFIDGNKTNRDILQSFFCEWLSILDKNKLMNLEDVLKIMEIKKGEK
ncbi:MAG: hypothetical protein PHD60_09635 [Clostridia bacterium]|nr:hypothetical protein [Clostridia bacterium]